ncbi:DUF2269 family protein [Paenibacillus nasutitermitis]|uniref:DUF2269 family protein n=1 Tax=Paenibacillus nasutitermitis TaxID=1652958 RepID=A0A917DWL8_9BACL|nr:hypothetical protein [Paenibacillus nasutitermitis]GGD77336.1 hypothetical protein GCM10010911_39200 [Paenibacillus nasutitermitis]
MKNISKISLTQRRWLLTAHLLFSAIMFGGAITFLILSITAATTTDEGVLKACYSGMHVLAKTSVRASAIGALVTGILLSVLTRWGLFTYYWIIAKEGLMIIAILLGPIGMEALTLKAVALTAAEGLNVSYDPAFTVNSGQLWMGIIIQILSIGGMFVLSVFKPWGSRIKTV